MHRRSQQPSFSCALSAIFLPCFQTLDELVAGRMVAALCGADNEKIAHSGRGLRRPGLRDSEIGTAEARILQVLLPQCRVSIEGGGDEKVPDAIVAELDALL